MLDITHFFNLDTFQHKAMFNDERIKYVWDTLTIIEDYLNDILKPEILGEVHPHADLIGNNIYIAQGAVVEAGAYIQGPTYLGPKTVVRHGAYIRGKVITGEGCIIGHATEVKNSIFLNKAKAAHFAYVGDSILGTNVNLGAGTKLANFKIRGTEVVVNINGNIYPSGLRKFGAILGDNVSIGCNTVCNPGTLIAPNSIICPLVSVRGYYPKRSLIKS
ncbi:MAG: hypothetical protein B6242_12615 [Anaerolineaceae bacterium 4572_78]|nr:MAG: hypothetical protein B6242_12615 [Anaerolineaceae bacterium 4572_78]